MTMRSRFAGRCKKCGRAIKKGALIEYAPGEGAVHPGCVQYPATKLTATARHLRGLKSTYRGTDGGGSWEGDRMPELIEKVRRA